MPPVKKVGCLAIGLLLNRWNTPLKSNETHHSNAAIIAAMGPNKKSRLGYETTMYLIFIYRFGYGGRISALLDFGYYTNDSLLGFTELTH